ncbi:MAG: hypothetical protein CMO26_18415 [Thiotrichales bacterium]|nr:hypothetical protein [Thiotrichales bacterium]
MSEQSPEDLCKERCLKLVVELEDTMVAFEGLEQTLKHSITKVYIAVSDSEPNRPSALTVGRRFCSRPADSWTAPSAFCANFLYAGECITISIFCGSTEFRRDDQPDIVYQPAYDMLYQANSIDRNR